MSSVDQEKDGPGRSGTPVPRATFDLSRLPVDQAIAAWHESIGVVCEVRLGKPPEDRLLIRADAFHLDGVVLGTLESVPQSLNRSRARIARDGIEALTLHFVKRGAIGASNRDSEGRAVVGDLLVLDEGQPYRASIIDNGLQRDLIVPRRLLAPLLKEPDAQNARIAPAAAPLVSLLRNHVEALYDAAAAMTLEEARAALAPTLQLAAAVLNDGVSDENAGAVKIALVQEIRRFIDAHAVQPDLTADTIAAAFAMSPRSLYRLFEPHGGVMAYLQKRRLYLVHSAITDPAQRHRNIHDISESHGFLHSKTFTAAFRRVFGMTPREARAFALDGRANAAAARRNGQSMWDWIRDMR